MKKTYLILIAFAFLTGITLLNSCKKTETETTDLATLNQEQASDESSVSSSSDAVDDEIDNAISTSTIKGAYNLPCNVTIDSSLIVNHKMTITFIGDNCAGTRTRSGNVVVTLTQGQHWSDVGAVITVQFNNVKIVNKATQRYIILNGTKTHTNVSGGLIKNLGLEGTPSSIVRKIESSDMNITFTNGTQKTWNIARMRTFTMVNGSVIITVSGFGEADGKSNLTVWGTNRRGTAFYTQIVTPVVMSQACDYNPSSGEVMHYVALRTIDVTFGTDAIGNPVTEGCADYYKISWTITNETKTVILPY